MVKRNRAVVKWLMLAVLLLVTALGVIAVGNSPIADFAREEWVVALLVSADCSQSEAGQDAMLVGTVLADGTILSAGHGFWCNHDQSDPVLDPTVFVNGAAIVLNRQRTPNPAVQESMDLARVCPFPALSGGLVLAEKLPATTPDTLWTGQVWIVGYGRTGALETIAARVTNRDALYPGGTMEIRIKEPISPGLSGSPVLNAAGEVIGVVVAKSVEEPVIYATCVTRELIAELDRELWGAGGE